MSKQEFDTGLNRGMVELIPGQQAAVRARIDIILMTGENKNLPPEEINKRLWSICSEVSSVSSGDYYQALCTYADEYFHKHYQFNKDKALWEKIS